MKLKHPIFFLPLAAVLGLALGFSIVLLMERETAPTSPAEGRLVPHFQVAVLSSQGEEFLSNSILSDSDVPVVVNFFASWCVPCLAEHPLLMDLSERSDLRLYGIAWRDKSEDTRAWLSRHGSPFSLVGMDEDSKAAIEWGITGIPETFFIDKDSRVVFAHHGPLTEETLSIGLRALDLRR